MVPSTQVTFRNMTAIEDVRKDVENRIQKLETFCKPILSCRVTIEAPAKHHRKGDPFHVHIDATLSDGRVDVQYKESTYPAKKNGEATTPLAARETTAEHDCLTLTIREAFDAARRQLQDHARRRRAEVKTHSPSLFATIGKIFPAEGYGYLETQDGREVYFHANSVIGTHFEKLKPGDSTQFNEEPGQKGPQASMVRVIRTPPGGLEMPAHTLEAALVMKLYSLWRVHPVDVER